MKLWGWGGIIPWIGYRRVQMPCLVAAEMGITQSRLVDRNMDAVWVDALEVEWFGAGITLAVRGVQ
jgi:hypothetical protein